MNPLSAALQDFGERYAFISNGEKYTYKWLKEKADFYEGQLKECGLPLCSCVALESEFSPYAAAMMLACLRLQFIYVPLSIQSLEKKAEFLKVAEVEFLIKVDQIGAHSVEALNQRADHVYYRELRERKHPGLVLFSSGSTGKSKAAVHDFSCLLEKFEVRRSAKVTLAFLLFDHIGGINTLLHVISNGGTLVTVADRSPEVIAAAVDSYSVQVLPTSPTFCNLMLMREIPQSYSLATLELITYGTEPMQESTLKRLKAMLPNVKFQQTYGLSEIGILRSKSESDESLWVRLGGGGFETRVRDGLLEIKARSAMLGYLNAESPFTEDGWFKTGDMVEVKGDYFRILGRKSDLINVGGLKVYPAEVESHLLDMEEVQDVVVYGEPHPIIGTMVVAKIHLKQKEDLSQFRIKLRKFLEGRVQSFMVPQKILVTDETLFGARFKRSRSHSS